MFSANLSAMHQVRTSGVFKQALRAALAAGNYLNHGTRNGAAIGFRCAPARVRQGAAWAHAAEEGGNG